MEWSRPEPLLRAGGLALRPFSIDDAGALSEACADAAIARFTFMKLGLTESEAREWINAKNAAWQNGQPRFAIVDAKTDRLLGQLGIAVSEESQSAELFYWVVAAHRGRGVASSAVGLVCDWAFERGVERIFLVTHLDNDASQRVAARCGFTREGILRGYERFKGARPDVMSWSLLATDPRPWHRP